MGRGMAKKKFNKTKPNKVVREALFEKLMFEPMSEGNEGAEREGRESSLCKSFETGAYLSCLRAS